MPSGGNLYADKLQMAIDTMQEKQMYSEILFYLEACESGSMFPRLLPSDNVYAMTASDAKQSSWAAYCSPHDVVGETKINTCLGDLFSVNWMEDTENGNPATETIGSQHESVVKKTSKSPVLEFGNMDIKKEVVGDFEGVEAVSDWYSYLSAEVKSTINKHAGTWLQDPLMNANLSTVDSRDIKLHYMYQAV